MNDEKLPNRGYWLRVALGVLTTVATIGTAVWPDWIEEIFHVDPDGGNGSVEIGIVLVLAVASVLSWVWAYAGWKRFSHQP